MIALNSRPYVLPHNVYRTLSQSSKHKVDGASRKFRRNLKQPGNSNRGVCLDVLGVLQTYPGGEHREPTTSRFFDDVGSAHAQLLAWARTMPAQSQALLELAQALRNPENVDGNAIILRLEEIARAIDVYTQCNLIAPISAPAADTEAMDATNQSGGSTQDVNFS
jgi:hypothetical protein